MQKVKKLVPQLRFPEFDSIWDNFKFEDDENLIQGDGDWILSENISENEKIGIVQLGSIGQGALLNKELKTISESDFVKINGTLLNKGDILINRMVDNNLYCCIFDLDGKYVTSVDVCWIRKSEYFINEFIVNLILTYKHQKKLLRLSSGSGRVRISKKNLFGKFQFFIPSILEQQKIANFLTAIDSRIQSLEKKKSLLEQYKKGVMQQIFKQEIRFKDEGGREFPKWEKKRLGELTYKVGKKNKENIQYPIYSINNQEGFRPQSEQFEGLDSNDRGYDISLYKIVNEKTFAYNPARINVGSIGYSYELNKVIISSLYVCFKTKKELEDLYLLAYLDTDKFNQDILRYQEGGVRQYLFYENFSHIKIPLPSNEEQTKIAKFLSIIDKKIELVNEQIEKTKTYKKGLLQQMFV